MTNECIHKGRIKFTVADRQADLYKGGKKFHEMEVDEMSFNMDWKKSSYNYCPDCGAYLKGPDNA